jgi:hypothetical protein
MFEIAVVLAASMSLLILVLCGAEILAMARLGRSGWLANENMPSELRSARLVLNETELRDPEGRRIRVDQVFELPDGSLVVVDTKTRRRHEIRQSDVDQVKRYRATLRLVYGRELARRAYIRTVIRSYSQNYHRVRYNPITFT